MLDLIERNVRTAQFLAADPVKGVRTGRTPYEVVFHQNKSKVHFYRPEKALHRPVFISMPLINTWTIFDLLPGRSVIEKLLAAGVPVYLMDWGRPGDEDAQTSLVQLIDGLLHRAMDRSRRHARATYGEDTELDAIGYCVGGTFLAAYLARHPAAVQRACFVATPIDFHSSGRLVSWANPGTFPLDDLVDDLGNFPADLMRTSFQWLKPSGMTAKWMGLWERIDQDGFAELWSALEQWNGDNVDFPGEAYRAYVRGCYFDNALMSGTWVLGNQRTDLSRCSIPAHVISASTDHIVPTPAANGLQRAWGGEVTTEVIKGGHVGICVGSRLPHALVAWVQT